MGSFTAAGGSRANGKGRREKGRERIGGPRGGKKEQVESMGRLQGIQVQLERVKRLMQDEHNRAEAVRGLEEIIHGLKQIESDDVPDSPPTAEEREAGLRWRQELIRYSS
jgi:hypothetical protein